MWSDDLAINILVIFGSISLLCSLLTLYLIYKMKRSSGLLLLITNLTISQIFYDISIIMIVNNQPLNQDFYVSMRCFSGLMSTFWTNVISIIICYTIKTLKIINIKQYFNIIFIILFIPSCTIAIIVPLSTNALLSVTSDVYYYLRIASIIVNIIIYIYVSILIRYKSAFQSIKSIYNNPILTLAYRMKYYPIVQIICRLGALWYEQFYGYGYGYDDQMPNKEKISLILYSFTLPSAGIGYFIIFLLVTPDAINQFKLLFQFKHNIDDKIIIHNHFNSTVDDREFVVFNSSFHIDSQVKPSTTNSSNNSNSLNISILQTMPDYRNFDDEELIHEIDKLYSEVNEGVNRISFFQ